MANMGAGKGADYTGLVGRNSLTTQHQELFQSYVPGMPSGSMIVNPHVRVPGLKLARRLVHSWWLRCAAHHPRPSLRWCSHEAWSLTTRAPSTLTAAVDQLTPEECLLTRDVRPQERQVRAAVARLRVRQNVGHLLGLCGRRLVLRLAASCTRQIHPEAGAWRHQGLVV